MNNVRIVVMLVSACAPVASASSELLALCALADPTNLFLLAKNPSRNRPG
jgi:hypothetical protein